MSRKDAELFVFKLILCIIIDTVKNNENEKNNEECYK